MNESGAERVYVTRLTRPLVNAGVAVVSSTPGAQIDPWWLGSLDENDVQGYAGTPVNVNDLMPDVHDDVHAAGVVFPRPGQYFVSVDSGTRPADRPEAARPVRAPVVGRRHDAADRAPADDAGPRGPAADRRARHRPAVGRRPGLARARLSRRPARRRRIRAPRPGSRSSASSEEAPPLDTGRTGGALSASDLQETKNVSTLGPERHAEHAHAARRDRRGRRAGGDVGRARGRARACAAASRLLAVGGSTAGVRSVRFVAGGTRAPRRAAAAAACTARRGRAAARGRHVLRVEVVDTRGRKAVATRVVRTGCG